jgi:hypothetical protein
MHCKLYQRISGTFWSYYVFERSRHEVKTILNLCCWEWQAHAGSSLSAMWYWRSRFSIVMLCSFIPIPNCTMTWSDVFTEVNYCLLYLRPFSVVSTFRSSTLKKVSMFLKRFGACLRNCIQSHPTNDNSYRGEKFGCRGSMLFAFCGSYFSHNRTYMLVLSCLYFCCKVLVI